MCNVTKGKGNCFRVSESQEVFLGGVKLGGESGGHRGKRDRRTTKVLGSVPASTKACRQCGQTVR